MINFLERKFFNILERFLGFRGEIVFTARTKEQEKEDEKKAEIMRELIEFQSRNHGS